MKKLFLTILIALSLCIPSIAVVCSTATVPATRTTGTNITATIWNSDIVALYTWINANVVAALNVLTTKGDIYAYTGAALTRLAVGTNNQILTTDSATGTGLKWSTVSGAVPLATKGDIPAYGASATYLSVGTTGQFLVADSAQTVGYKWSALPSGIPKGTIIAWSPTYAGTNTIPTGWLLCDGTSSTPNLIGKFIVGTRPNTGTSAAASSSFGVQTCDANGAGATSHTHDAFGVSVVTGTASLGNGVTETGVPAAQVPTAHTHSFSVTGTPASANLEPCSYALVYIMKAS